MRNLDIKKLYEWPILIQILLAILLAIFVFLLLHTFQLKGYRQTINASIQQEDDLRRQLRSLIEKQISVKSGLSQIKELKEKLATWQSRIPKQEDVSEMDKLILEVAQTNNLNIVNFKPQPSLNETLFNKNIIQISVSGNYDQIAKYVSDLINLPKLLVVESMTLSGDTSKDVETSGFFKPINAGDIYTADIAITIYSRK